jgi:hypothetical protein
MFFSPIKCAQFFLNIGMDFNIDDWGKKKKDLNWQKLFL